MLQPPRLTVSPSHITEAEVRSKDITYVNLTLEGDAWHPSIGTDVESTTRWLGYTLEARQARGAAEWLAYTHSEEPWGWHAIARHTVTVRPLTPNTLLLMLGWLPEFDLTAPEHVYVTGAVLLDARRGMMP